MEKGWRGLKGVGGGDQTGCILEFEQIANQAAKLEGFVGECVREREVKRKEVLEKKSTPRALQQK